MFEGVLVGLGKSSEGMFRGSIKGDGEEGTGEEQGETTEGRKVKRRSLPLSRGWSVHLPG